MKATRLASILLATVSILASDAISSDCPRLINYQGRVTNSGGSPIADGSYPATFRFFTTPTGGVSFWTEASTISVAGGLFTHILGSVTDIATELFPQNAEVWLEVVVNGETITPRTRLVSAPYALRTNTIDGSFGGTVFGDVQFNGSINAIGHQSFVRFQFDDIIDLPDPIAYHGMFAHVHATGKAYHAHELNGWVPLANEAHTHAALSTPSGSDVVIVDNLGNVGIGIASPTQKLHVVGNICATGTIGACSDARYKINVDNLTGGIHSIMQVRPVTYEWNRAAHPEQNFVKGQQIGFIAQELKAVLPQMVSEDTKGFLSVDYAKLTPVLVKALQEQQQLIVSQNATLTSLQNELTELKSMVNKLAGAQKTAVTLAKK